MAFLGNSHEAEEAAHASFIKAFFSLDRFRGSSSFRTWLTRIGVNQCKDALKARRRRRTVSLDGIPLDGRRTPAALVQEPAPDESDNTRVPSAALERLSRGEQAAWKLAASKPDFDLRALGLELGLTEDGVKGRLRRARAKIKAYWKRHVDS